MSLADELYARPTAHAWNQPTQPGLFLAEVVNLNDPQKLGRVKCRGLTDEKTNESDWCYVMAPLAGKAHGIQFMPDVGDMVVVGYIGGDRQRPLVLGCLWNNKITMPYPLKEGKNFSFTIKAPSGAEIVMTGEKGKEKVTVTTPGASKIVMDDENKSIKVTDKDGKNYINMDLKGGNTEVVAEKKLTLKSGGSSLVLESSGKATLTAKSTATVDAATVELKAKSSLKASGTQAEIKATSQLNLQSSGIAKLKGSMVNIN